MMTNKLLKSFLSIGFLLSIIVLNAQSSNIFLQRSYWKSQPEINDIRAKIKEGNDPAALTKHAFDAVAYAILEDVPNETIKYLLSLEGNDVNKMTHDGRTYLFWAASRGNLQLMEYLVEKGGDTRVVDDHGNTVMNFAANAGRQEIELYDFCINNGADLQNDKNHDGANVLLLLMPHIKDFTMVDYFTAKGLSIHNTDNFGNSTFNYAAKSGNMEMMDLLIENGVAHSELNNEGGNAMIFASMGMRSGPNSLEVFQYLESKGVEPNVVTKKGVTPLQILASRSQDTEVISYFLDKGVDINQADEDGNTALLNAASRNEIGMIEFLTARGADIHAVNKKGETVLSRAVAGNNPEVINFLIEKGARTDVKDRQGNNLGYYLVQSYNPRSGDEFLEKFRILKNVGLDPLELQQDDNTLLHLAVTRNDIRLIREIRQTGIDINRKNKEGLTALHLAAMKSSDDDILKYLIEEGADKGQTTSFQETAYELAEENELLSENRVDISFLK